MTVTDDPGKELHYLLPPTDGGGFRDFYHDWTNSSLQQLNFWKIEDTLFRWDYHRVWIVCSHIVFVDFSFVQLC